MIGIVADMDRDEVFACFVTYLIRDCQVSPDTASMYVSHVVKQLTESRAIKDSTSIRTDYLRNLLQGYQKEAAVDRPTRERNRIPVHMSLMPDIFLKIDNGEYSRNQKLRLKAAFAIGYGLSLRPGEYLSSSPPIPLAEKANSSRAFLWWGDADFSVCLPHLFPKGRADRFSLTIDRVKNDPYGKGGPRAIARNPESIGFCLVETIEKWIRSDPPPTESPLLSSARHTRGHLVQRQTVNLILKQVAIANNLDPRRLLPHSIRYGAIQGLVAHNFDEATLCRQGGWFSRQGMLTYQQSCLKTADATAIALHDTTAVPKSHIKHLSASTPRLDE